MGTSPVSSAEKWLKFLLRFNGVLAVGAIFAVVMPHSWLVWCVSKVDPDTPVRLLVSYLARTLSVFYLLLGLLLLLFATDVRRFGRAITLTMLWTLFAAALLSVQAAPSIDELRHSWFFWAMLGDGVYGLTVAVCILLLQRRVAKTDQRALSG